MSPRSLYISFLLTASLLACNAPKQAIDKGRNQPNWVSQRPAESNFFIGIGRSSKQLHPLDFDVVAKQNALEDLAGEITVDVRANSVLSQTENTNGYEESYRSQIRTQSNLTLEGFEVYDTWEDDERFYVLYRLSKSEWAQIQAAKKRKAIAQSKDWYNKALRADSLHRANEALKYYVKALEAIDTYLGDPLEELGPDGKTVFYGNEVYFHLGETLQGLAVQSTISKMTLKQGTLQENESLSFALQDQNGFGQQNLPVLIKYSEQLSRGAIYTSGSAGEVTYPIPVIRTDERIQYIRARFDAEHWRKEVTDNKLVNEILKGLTLKVSEAVIELEVLPPTFKLISSEKNLGKEIDASMLGSAVRSTLLSNGFASDTINPDYTIVINSDTDSAGTVRNMATCYLRGEMTILKGSEEIYRTSFHEIKGVQLNYKNAGMAAYREGVEWLTYEILPLWIDRVKPTR